MISTDLAVAVPEGTYGRVAPRSGLASKFSIDVGAGVVDADYRGTLHVLLFNYSDKDYEGKQAGPHSRLLAHDLCLLCAVSEGDRVAQFVLERIATPEIEEVKVIYPRLNLLYTTYISKQSLTETVRGAGGFGSSGK